MATRKAAQNAAVARVDGAIVLDIVDAILQATLSGEAFMLATGRLRGHPASGLETEAREFSHGE